MVATTIPTFARTAGHLSPRGAAAVAPSARSARSALVVTADGPLRTALEAELGMLRWSVRVARGAAEMFTLLEADPSAVCLLDSWLPDLQVRECVQELHAQHPEVDVIAMDGSDLQVASAYRAAFRAEALHALRRAQDRMDAPAWKSGQPEEEILKRYEEAGAGRNQGRAETTRSEPTWSWNKSAGTLPNQSVLRAPYVSPEPVMVATTAIPAVKRAVGAPASSRFAVLPEFVGTDPRMLEVSRRIQLVAHRKTAVLVHGPSGTGKELVARALHRLSGRSRERFIAINCAAIPEALMEAELFGHARGAFTGATQSRVGRIEAAAGGTLFLDEIGELPLPVQSKLLRFLESGEIQRVGENETVRVDARVVAATHRKLGAMAAEGTFRLDLLHRLSVFLIQTPALAERHADMDALIAASLQSLGAEEGPKTLSLEARAKLHGYSWPGNVRELQHTLERAWILAGDCAVIDDTCVDFGEALL